MSEFPKDEEFYDYLKSMYSSESGVIGFKKQYSIIKANFNTPEDFLGNIDDNKELVNDNLGSYHSGINSIIIFLSLKLNIRPNCNIQSIIVLYAPKIIDFFQLVPYNFKDAMNEKVVGLERRKQTFLIQIIKVLMYLEKSNITEITDTDLLSLRNSDFFKGRAKSERIPTLLQSVLAIINKKSLPRKLTRITNENKDYGTNLDEVKAIIKEYIDKKYINKGFREESPLTSIRCFFKWLHKEYYILKLEDVSIEHWEKYKAYVIREYDKGRTRQVKIDMVSKFFQWAQSEKKINKKIVSLNERYEGPVKCKPRAFDSREDYIKILKAIINFEPDNKREALVKSFLLIATATGLRLNEVLWLGPGCLIDEDGESGEIVLQIKEKLGFKNKTTSILKWGIEPLEELNLRFERIPNKIKFYDKKTKEYFYSIFQECDHTILSQSFIRDTFKKIMKFGNVIDENGESLGIESVNIHGFRHQKYTDIYCATNGSLTSVKVDSGHTSIKMAKTYIQQNEKERQLEALELIAQGKVVGRGAEIIKALIKTPYSAQRYLEIVRKMNVNVLKQEHINKKLRKSLGFGFCAGECCIKNACERCDFFYTCKTYINELKYRYSINFALLMSSIVQDNHETVVNSINKELAIDLKYQEKWLMELGLTYDDIYDLRKNILEEEKYNGNK